MRARDLDPLWIALLYIWSAANEARELAAVSAAEATADPLSWDQLKKRAVDRGIDAVINRVLRVK